MKPGGGKQKGGAFERKVCVALSLWISHGKNKDVFWRSAMSGGRATVNRKKGESLRQAGDICAVAPEGHAFTDQYFLECKHLRNLRLASFMLFNMGPLALFWKRTCQQAQAQDREPFLIAKQNNTPTLIVSYHWNLPYLVRNDNEALPWGIMLFDDFLKQDPSGWLK